MGAHTCTVSPDGRQCYSPRGSVRATVLHYSTVRTVLLSCPWMNTCLDTAVLRENATLRTQWEGTNCLSEAAALYVFPYLYASISISFLIVHCLGTSHCVWQLTMKPTLLVSVCSTVANTVENLCYAAPFAYRPATGPFPRICTKAKGCAALALPPTLLDLPGLYTRTREAQLITTVML